MANVTTISSKAMTDNTNKTAIVDDNGYYKIRLGRLNAFNKQGVYYRVLNLSKITGPGSVLNNRITEGVLRSEVSHPEAIRKAKTTQELIRAIMFIDLNEVCGHIKSVEFIDTGKPEKGFSNNIIEVYGWVKPSGKKKEILEDALTNPDENATFSIRSLVRNGKLNGYRIKDVLEISTWDFVYEPGVKGSSKWGAAGLEDLSLDIQKLAIDKFNELTDGTENACSDARCVIDNLLKAAKEENSLFDNWMLG